MYAGSMDKVKSGSNFPLLKWINSYNSLLKRQKKIKEFWKSRVTDYIILIKSPSFDISASNIKL